MYYYWNSMGRHNTLSPNALVAYNTLPPYSGTFSVVKSQDLVAYQDFGSLNNLGSGINSEFVFDNLGGFSSVGFYASIPSGGQVNFEGSFDGINYSEITFRDVGTDGYVQHTDHDENFIGSISSLRKFRCRVAVAGSTSGYIMGRAQRDVCTLEGIEHANPPHKIGSMITRRSFEITTQQTSGILWTPATGKKIVITDLVYSAEGNGIVSFFDEIDRSQSSVAKASIKTPNGETTNIIINFSLPFVSDQVNNQLRITTTSALTIYGTAHGYETYN